MIVWFDADENGIVWDSVEKVEEPLQEAFDRTWTIGEAMSFIDDLWDLLEPHRYHVALTGSVLVNSISGKDLDIILYPACTQGSPPIEAIRDVLKSFGMRLRLDHLQIKRVRQTMADPRRRNSQDTKMVDMWEWRGKRVDIFWWPR